ncbi:MAG: TIGR02444 family protein [Alphaproteobacteria bacterium]|nr:TIGR02444 family protein [Alphaproteobacteria bacterium]
MSETPAPNSQSAKSQSPFWRFSISFYAVPGVAPACIELQDRAGVDVNVLFFLLWSATLGRALSAAEVAALDKTIGAWRDMTVVPLRNIRRALKEPPAIVAPGIAETFRSRIKSAELEAERLQQEAMYGLTLTGPLGQPAANAASAAKASTDAYQSVLGPFPTGPLEAILSALAKFDPGPSGGA